ncbi:MAG: hypothetical protein ACO3EE_05395 [Flavobacteriales bacterium]
MNRYDECSKSIQKQFSFLEKELGYTIIENSTTNYGSSIKYVSKKNNRQVWLTYDYREDFFYFYIVKGWSTEYSDHDQENIKIIIDLLNKTDNISPKDFHPANGDYRNALELNIRLLKDRGMGILKGEKWFD